PYAYTRLWPWIFRCIGAVFIGGMFYWYIGQCHHTKSVEGYRNIDGYRYAVFYIEWFYLAFEPDAGLGCFLSQSYSFDPLPASLSCFGDRGRHIGFRKFTIVGYGHYCYCVFCGERDYIAD